MSLEAMARGQWGPAVVGLIIGLFLLVFLVAPVLNVIYVAFQDPNTGALTLINFVDFFRTSLFQESSINSIYVAGMSVVLASCFALPLAYFTTRFHFSGATLIQTLGVLPLIMPPFVGAVAMLLLLGENGSVNLLLDEWFGFTIPFMEGLNGVILVESIHYFRSSSSISRPRSTTSTAQWRNRPRTWEPAACACFAASCFRWPCPATSQAHPWYSSKCSTTSARRFCST